MKWRPIARSWVASEPAPKLCKEFIDETSFGRGLIGKPDSDSAKYRIFLMACLPEIDGLEAWHATGGIDWHRAIIDGVWMAKLLTQSEDIEPLHSSVCRQLRQTDRFSADALQARWDAANIPEQNMESAVMPDNCVFTEFIRGNNPHAVPALSDVPAIHLMDADEFPIVPVEIFMTVFFKKMKLVQHMQMLERLWNKFKMEITEQERCRILWNADYIALLAVTAAAAHHIQEEEAEAEENKVKKMKVSSAGA